MLDWLKIIALWIHCISALAVAWIHCGVCNNAIYIISGNFIIKITNSFYLVQIELCNSADDTHVMALQGSDYYKSRSICRSALHLNMQSRVVTEVGVHPFATRVGGVSYNNLSMPLIKWQGIMIFLTPNIFTSVKYYTFKGSSVLYILSWPLFHSLLFQCSGYLFCFPSIRRECIQSAVGSEETSFVGWGKFKPFWRAASYYGCHLPLPNQCSTLCETFTSFCNRVSLKCAANRASQKF